MKRNSIAKALLAVGILVARFFSCNVVFADDTPNSTLTVSPSYQNIVLEPGTSFRGSITISNAADAKQPLDYSAFIGSFSQSKSDDSKDDYGAADVLTESSYNQIMKWITLDKESGSVQPNASETLGFTVNVPTDAPAGGQYATIIVRNDTGGTTDNVNGNVAIQNVFQFASIIYAEVTGETRKTGQVLENNMPSMLFQGPLEATSMVKNTGNVHANAKYTLQVWPLFSGEEICTNEENPKIGLVLPETEKYVTQSCTLPMVGIFKAKQTVTIFGETDILEKTIVVCPLWLLFIIIFAIVALIIWLILRAKNRGNKRRTEA